MGIGNGVVAGKSSPSLILPSDSESVDARSPGSRSTKPWATVHLRGRGLGHCLTGLGR